MRCIALPPDRYFTTRLGVDVKKFMSTYLHADWARFRDPRCARGRVPHACG